MARPHVQHVLEHLDRVRGRHTTIPNPEAVFLGGDEGAHFWELVGLRMRGLPVVLLAALRFQRNPFPGATHARESLASYLSLPPAPRTTDELGAIPALLPSSRDTIPVFLRGLQMGRAPTPVHLDPSGIDLAFDFRVDNPAALEALKRSAGPLRGYAMRTLGGHVLWGHSHEIRADRSQPNAFVAVRAPVQVAPGGDRVFPTLILNRRFLLLTADTTDEPTRIAARSWSPFMAATANPESVVPLDDSGF
jgi:hypothetical protein